MDNQTDEIEIDLAELLYFLQDKIGWLVIVFIMGAFAAGIVTKILITPLYTASSKVYMVSASNESVLNLSDLNLGTSLSQDYEELIRIRPVFNEVITQLNLDYEYEEMLKLVQIEPVGNTRLLKISVKDPSPQRAQMIANALADAAVTYIPKLMNTSEPNIAEYAIVPRRPSSPNVLKNSLLIGGVCMLLLLGSYVIAYMRDDTIKNSDDLERYFGIIPLTVVPEGKIDSINDDIEGKRYKKRRRKLGRRRIKKKNGELWDLN